MIDRIKGVSDTGISVVNLQGKRVTATSASAAADALTGRVVAPRVVMYGQLAGKSGEKILPPGPRHPSALPESPARPATPESPEATQIETP